MKTESVKDFVTKIIRPEVKKFDTDIKLPCRVWLEYPNIWIADCQVLGLTTFNNTEDSAKNSLINRIRLDLALRSKGMN